MSWQLTLHDNYLCSGEFCLDISHLDRDKQLRCWFGPFAQQLFYTLKSIHPPLQNHHKMPVTDIDKQLAQHLLIQASFNHQRCLQQFQIIQDIEQKGLKFTPQLGELLLYIRMTSQHPSQSTIQQFINTQLPWCDSAETALDSLVEAKLIQRITYRDQVFYDKNPYPHDHLLDPYKQKLVDYIGQQPTQPNQWKLISQTHPDPFI